MYANFILLPSLLAAVASGILLDDADVQSNGYLEELETRGQEDPTPSIEERNILEARDICDKDAKQPAGRHYTLYNNLWNLQPGQKSPQCSNVDSVNGNVISWHSKSVLLNIDMHFTPHHASDSPGTMATARSNPSQVFNTTIP